jgi:hypothetical protein
MKFFHRKLVAVASFLGISTINLIFSGAAISAVSCEAGTISRHPNGSLQYCLLAFNTKITISNNRVGTSIFPCKAKTYISFAQNSQFERCTLSEDIKIRENNFVRTCPKDYIVSVSILNDSKELSIECLPD